MAVNLFALRITVDPQFFVGRERKIDSFTIFLRVLRILMKLFDFFLNNLYP